MPACLSEYAKLVASMEAEPPPPPVIAALERDMARAVWDAPQDREAAQVLLIRLAYLRHGALAAKVPGP